MNHERLYDIACSMMLWGWYVHGRAFIDVDATTANCIWVCFLINNSHTSLVPSELAYKEVYDGEVHIQSFVPYIEK